MNILVLNGSPKGEKSNTSKLANAFINGIKTSGNHSIEKITVTEKNVQPCRGCFCCWEKTPGKCVIADDMSGILTQYNNAELIIWSFPLYVYGMPAKIQGLLERLVMLNNLPDIVIKEDGSARHLKRNESQNQRHVLISTCGFFTVQNNFEPLIKKFEIMFADRCAKILCPQGELFRIPQLEERTNEYLSCVKKAGEEYINSGHFSAETQQVLSEQLYPTEQFLEMANVSWERGTASGETMDAAARLLRQMSAIYKPHGKDKDIIIEFYFTDLGKTYQLVLGKKNCAFKDTELLPYTMRIESSFETWNAISEGKLDGKEALFQHKYSVKGDFSATEYLTDCFAKRSGAVKETNVPPRKRAMWLFILPWVAFWTAIPLSPGFGAYIALAFTSAMPLFYSKYKPTVYDALSVFCVVILSISVMLQFALPVVVTLSYIVFGLFWLGSLFTRVPLCAWYSSNEWGDDEAFNNPLFILTNKIICAGWGALYLVSALWTWGLMNSGYSPYTGLINSLAPVLMGIFTVFFSKRFPAHYAQKNISK
jgi:multimeric flavodoxin WrbA/putative sterol carrier protein